MYRKDARSYLHELMRVDSAVTSVTGTLEQTGTWRLEGINVNLPKDTGVQYVLATANRDASVFPNPSSFNPERPEIGESLSWNGRLQDVIARNYSAAPRFCPGYHLSVKIAEAVCSHLTVKLDPWGNDVPVDEGLAGTVKILAPGKHQGHEGVVAYFDFNSKQHCIIDKARPNVQLGCYKREQLYVIDHRPAIARTLKEEQSMCPTFAVTAVQMLIHQGAKGYQSGWSRGLLQKVAGVWTVPEVMSDDWADDYTVALYMGISTSIRIYASRHSNSLRIPTKTGTSPTFRVGHILAPNVDIDHPNFMPIEWYIPETLFDLGFLTSFNCFHGILRSLPWEDAMEDDVQNSWKTIFAKQKGQYPRKKDFVMSFWKPYETLDGVAAWPRQEYDFEALYWKQDMWDDGLERAIAFGQIGVHRVLENCGPVEMWRGVSQFGSETCMNEPFRGESLRYVVPLNIYNQLEVRPHFGKYGGDMYFNEEGLPIVIKTPDGSLVAKGDPTWQYWKFVWRSSLITVITLVDHLHMTHFRAANILAGSIRKTLSPNHPIRRFLSIFSFGSIFVNLNAMHTLIGPNHVLHRSSPFKNFEALSDLVPKSLPALSDYHRPIFEDEHYKKLPALLQQAPYYQDGRLLAGALKEVLLNMTELYGTQLCKPNGEMIDKEMISLWQELSTENTESGYKSRVAGGPPNCTTMFEATIAVIWTVTGWHRHVGTVGDYYVDPDLASFSWKEGEAFARPRQHMQMSAVAAFTSTAQPKLGEDFSHIMQGIEREADAVAVLENFRRKLRTVHDEIEARNDRRMQTWGFKHIHADPEVVECSVAV